MARVSKTQIDSWKKQYGDILHIPFSNGKECYLKQPDRRVLGLAYSKGARDPMAAAEVILANCWLDGDEVIKTETGYLVTIQDMTNEIAGRVEVEIQKFADCIKLAFEDGKKCQLKYPTRPQASEIQLAARKDPFAMVEKAIQFCWQSGDEEIKTSIGHLLSMLQAIDELLQVKTAQVKKI